MTPFGKILYIMVRVVNFMSRLDEIKCTNLLYNKHKNDYSTDCLEKLGKRN